MRCDDCKHYKDNIVCGGCHGTNVLYEPLVRCKNCFHFEPYGHPDAVGVCKLNNGSEWNGDEDYCSKWHEEGE